MFDRSGINKRYLSCFPGITPRELAKKLGIKHPMVYQWISGKRQVPWEKLKDLVDTQAVSWDWLIEGSLPKHRKFMECEQATPLNRHGINQRFLSLFPDMSQKKLAELFSVSQMTVYRWHKDISQIPWEKRQYAVHNKIVTWEWLLEGREFKK